LLFDWTIWGRTKQQPPKRDWGVWLIMAGRGFGKSRSGAEWVRQGVEANAFRRIALVAETAADARDVMVEGESGLLRVCSPWARPKYEPSKRRLTWPNGAIGTTFSADDPDQLRGAQFNAAWAAKIAKWRYPDSWDNLMLGLRLGNDPRCVATTTPKPRAWLNRLMADPGCVVTHGGTQENAGNLASVFLERIMATYRGTRLARQEIDGEYLIDAPGALWRRSTLEAARGIRPDQGDFDRIVVALDPAVTDGAASSETGILVV
jgi:phage terminase large subunit-like protein